ncbi:MAG: C45 family peptidase [Pseudomonadota bacterium]
MFRKSNAIGWCVATGSSREIGRALGRQGRRAVQSHLVHSAIWAQVTDAAHNPVLTRIADTIRHAYPDIWTELEGLAEGLDLPFRDVLAWNCRGDLLASVPDGCTTVQIPGNPITIAHNEDGLPFFRGSCFVADLRPTDGTGIRAFCYPGSMPGHTFGWNDAGLVSAVNNLRLLQIEPCISRMVLCRNVLNCLSIDEAVGKLTENPQSGGFHMSIAQVGDERLLSVEYGGGAASVRAITETSLHANHALHLAHESQTITQSSGDRQRRGEQLISQETQDSLVILRDASGTGLPIRRDDPADPDNENTLATCIFNVSSKGIEWRIYSDARGGPIYQSERAAA